MSPAQSVWMPAPSQPWRIHTSSKPAAEKDWYESSLLSWRKGDDENFPESIQVQS